MRKKLNDVEKKARLTVTINPTLHQLVNERNNNVSKYVEWLIYQDLKKYSKNEKINKIII